MGGAQNVRLVFLVVMVQMVVVQPGLVQPAQVQPVEVRQVRMVHSLAVADVQRVLVMAVVLVVDVLHVAGMSRSDGRFYGGRLDNRIRRTARGEQAPPLQHL
jgi:hypothetical protein